MKKISVICLILSLVLLTAYIKNSTKRIDDEIFLTKENIRGFKKDYGKVKLEHDYLSSAEKLLEFQVMYFDDELIKKDIKKIKIINQSLKKLNLEKLKFVDE